MPPSKPDSKFVSQETQGLQRAPQARRIDVSLRSGIGKTLVLLAVALPALLLGMKVTEIAQAARFGNRLDVQDLHRAAALDPGNAEYYHQLGLIYAYSLNEGDPAKAIKHLQEATELNPRNAFYWADLADVCDSNGDAACANQAVSKAVSLSPMTPRFEWLAGNHYLQRGHPEQAMDHFRSLLALDDTYAQPVFQVCLRAVGDPQTVFQKVLPANNDPVLQLAYLDAVSNPSNIDFANQVWEQISSNGFSGSVADAKPYLECLLNTGNVPQAEKVWQDLIKAGVVRKPSIGDADNLVYNGGFEQTPLDAGFDWQDPNTPSVEADFRDPSAYRGSHCLRVDYAAGHNFESEPVSELVPVDPRQSYRLTAYARSEGITSDSGPRLRVVDPECPDCLSVSTPPTLETTPWHLLTLDFTTGAKTRVVWLSVWRPRSRTFPMEIGGSFWLDNVILQASKAAPPEAVAGR